MTDALPTVWKAEPHTLVKHAILRRYLQAWLPILTQQAQFLRRTFGTLQSREILFIDGFAGPGEYTGGEPGSPVIALQSAIEHCIQFPMPVRMLFIEHRDDRFERLNTILAPHLGRAKSSSNIHAVEPIHGECDERLNALLDEYERQQIKFGPALAFLDQFGYGAVSMDLIKRIMSYGQCEVFTYLSYKEMNRWITDSDKADAFTRAFGGEEWRQCIGLHERERRQKLLELYKDALKKEDRGNVKYVVSFLMFDKNASPLYWLLFGTNSLRGLEEMKKAMWHADKTGEFRFSDNDAPGQLRLLGDSFDPAWLAGVLRSRLAGRAIDAIAVKEIVLLETPCYLFKEALSKLESAGTAKVIAAPVGRKTGTYPDDQLNAIRLQFDNLLFG